MLIRAAHWAGTIALIAIAVALAIYSVQLNYQYAIWLFGSLGVDAPLLYAFGLAAADIGKLALPWVIAQQWIAGRRLSAGGTAALMIGLAAASIWALVSLGLQGREGIAGAARVQFATLTDLKAERADFKAQLAGYGTVAGPDVLERKMQAMRFDKRWASTAGCTQATRNASRTFCAEHGQLFSQLAGATKAEQLRAQIVSLNHRIATARTASGNAAPYAAQVVLARLLGIDSDTIGGVTLLGLAILIEILALVMAAAALEQIRRLVRVPQRIPAAGRESGLNDAHDYSDFTDLAELDAEIDASSNSIDQLSLQPCPAVSNVTPLRPRRNREKSLSLRVTNSDDQPSLAMTAMQELQSIHPTSGRVGNLALVSQADPANLPEPVSVSPSVLVLASPCPLTFWDACVARSRDSRVSAADLYARYRAWCQERGLGPLSQTAMTRRIKAGRKVQHRKSDGRMVYMGVRLRAA